MRDKPGPILRPVDLSKAVTRPAPQLQIVPRVFYVDEPGIEYLPNGAAQVTSRRAPQIEDAVFTPADYGRRLRQWSQFHMPREQPTHTVKATRTFGLVLLTVAVIALIGGQLAGSTAGLVACGVLVCLAWGCFSQAYTWNRYRHDTAGFSAAIAASSRGEAYYHLDQGHPGRAAQAWNQANQAQRWADQQRAHDWQQAEAARARDQAFWTDLDRQPHHVQWQAATWFRLSIAEEYSRRTAGRVPPYAVPLPSYDDVVHALRATPSPW